MQPDNLSSWTHSHAFGHSNPLAERSTRLVMWITAAMMVVEVAAGWWFNAMALLMVFGSFERLLTPQAIHSPEGTAIAVLGLLFNWVCAVLLGRAHQHGQGQAHAHGHAHEHAHGHAHGPQPDLNLKSAHVHGMADAATSVLTIAPQPPSLSP